MPIALPRQAETRLVVAEFAERLVYAGVFLLPLAFWPGLEHPFSTPKIWLLASLVAVLAVLRLARGSVPSAIRETSDWPWQIWLAALALSALLAPYVSWKALLFTTLPVPLCLAVRRGDLSVRDLEWTILASCVPQSVIVVLQFAGFDPFRLAWTPEIFSSPRMRIYGTLGNPNFVAAWGCAVLPLFAGRISRSMSRTRNIAWTAALILQVAAVLATGSRGWLPALAAAGAVMAVRGARFRRPVFAGLAIAGVLLWFSSARPLLTTLEGRLYLARVAMSHWQQIPLFGCGPGSFELQFAQWQVEWLQNPEHLRNGSQFAASVDHAHNDYVEILVEYGPAGLLALCCLWSWIMRESWRSHDREGMIGAWGGTAALLAVAFVDFPFHRPAEWALSWILLGMLSAVQHKEKS